MVRSRLGFVTWKRVLLVWTGLALFAFGVLVGQGRLGFSVKQAYAPRTGLSGKLDYSGVDAVYKVLKDNYDGTLTEQQVLDGLKHGLAQSTKDPYTEFFTA